MKSSSTTPQPRTEQEDGQFTSLLRVCTNISSRLDYVIGELREQREEAAEFRQEMYDYQNRTDGRLGRIEENQQATFEILIDMSEAVSDHMLTRKIRKKSEKLKKSLISRGR